ncbi:MAG: ABC transporter ATP-binding protein [Anaerolineae bacterium]|nr:ABC transporter ATP-binding protein [Anaerolineae bacterium]MCB0244198.1 ABC transporter ATP-binding protein [Anaerolineae bacterium]MCB9132626.1 ABC transporter ATP-binding protein [Anaerolineales bacterium]MCB9141738.1 ABC transporter ATP-binding protein [Anaerolineales bacterium]HRX02544.1 ABC transporter ATP-binding protein [Anaerolineae bacterium]
MKRLNIYGRLIAYLKPYWRQAVLAYAAMFFATLLNLFVPLVIARAIDQGLESGQATALFVAAAIILGIALVRALASFGQRYFGEWLTYRVAYDLRNEFYDSVQQLPFSFHDKAHTGDLMSRATGDISETERFVGIGLMEMVSTLLLMAGVTIAMLLVDPTLAALALIPFPILIFSTLRFGAVVRPLSRLVQDQLGLLSTTMQESLTGIRVVKAFAREPYEFFKFDKDNDHWFALRERLIKVWGNNWPLFTFLISLSIFLLLWFGGPLALNGTITVGALFAMISYVLMLNGPVQRLGFLVNLTATAGASASRVFEITDTPSDIEERSDAHSLDRHRGQVVFEQVSFGYRDGLNVLHDISFAVQPGQTVALMGPTGSGKSSVISLIPRFYDPVEGRVLVDGIDVRDLTLDSLRASIGIVLQEPFLFSATIAQNIAYGRPDASNEEIIAAAKLARAHDFIAGFPDGYNTRVGERGVTLSGGQKQRVAIARALLYDPRILILDDSTSSVDTETEHLIQQALQTLMQGRTTFVIAQRLLTLKSADQILVLDHGRIVQRGTHDQLLAQGGLYREIYDLQLRDQEEFLALEAVTA